MSHLHRVIALATVLLALRAFADDATTPVTPAPNQPTAPPAATTPAQPTPPAEIAPAPKIPTEAALRPAEISYLGLVRAPGDKISLSWRSGAMMPLGVMNVQLGISPMEMHFRPWSVKTNWLPTSLYFLPYIENAQFTKTGAAITKHTLAITRQNGPGGMRIDSTTTSNTVAIPDAKTTYTYTKFAVYGVVTANMNHVFDWRAKPLLTENDRAGIGLMWGTHGDIADGVAYDKGHPFGVQVKLTGMELTHSFNSTEKIWYLSLISAMQK